MKPYPRASQSEADGVALPASLFNRMVEDLERLGRLSVQPPLTLSQGPAGATLGINRPIGEIVLVAIIGAETGGGRYKGSILYGSSTGSTTTKFQLSQDVAGTGAQTETDGPAFFIDTTSDQYVAVNNALVVNVMEPYVTATHVLHAGTSSSPLFTLGKVMGYTAEATPRTIVYVETWPMQPVIAKITTVQSPNNGVYGGRILQGQFCDGNNFGELYAITQLDPSNLPTADNCWINNTWEKVNGSNVGLLTAGTFVFGLTAGFPAAVLNGTTVTAYYQVYTWLPPQSPALTSPPQPLATPPSQFAGTTYTTNEQQLLNNLKHDLTNLYNTFTNYYANMQLAGYSK
jgi:hypothetical protein